MSNQTRARSFWQQIHSSSTVCFERRAQATPPQLSCASQTYKGTICLRAHDLFWSSLVLHQLPYQDSEQLQVVGASVSCGLGPGQKMSRWWRRGGEAVGAGAVKPVWGVSAECRLGGRRVRWVTGTCSGGTRWPGGGLMPMGWGDPVSLCASAARVGILAKPPCSASRCQSAACSHEGEIGVGQGMSRNRRAHLMLCWRAVNRWQLSK